jgi:DNA-binding transcriptional MerR regulator/mannose-6-phosphate isomerase-like protein (cupin superfamily)
LAVPYLNIQKTAQAAGVSPSALRLWERRGLLVPRKTPRGHRRYTQDDVSRIRDIRRLRSLQGLNLAAIAATLGLNGRGPVRGALPEAVRELGRRLQAFRSRNGMTLREASGKTGLAPSFISSIEHGVGRPSVASLQKLARCYGTTVSALTAHRTRTAGKLVRAGRYRVLPMLGEGIKIEQLAEGRLAMDCQRFTLAPGAGSEGQYAHEGEEFIHVLAGRFEITLAGRERYRLGPGDSMYFKSDALHAWRNPGLAATELLWINTPPTF